MRAHRVSGGGAAPGGRDAAQRQDPDDRKVAARPRLGGVAGVLVVLCGLGCAHGGWPAGRVIVWEGAVTVREDVVIERGETLVIRPGTRVSFAFRDADGDGAGDARIIAKGGVRAVGTSSAPIEFAPEREGPLPRWTEILIEDAPRAEFVWCRFSGARHPLHAHRTPLLVEHGIFERNEIGVRFTGGPVALRRNRFSGNGTAVRYWESSPEIVANSFDGNATAVFVREGSARTVLTGNNFAASADYHVKLGEAQTADVDARENWWGTVRTEEIERLIYDRLDADYLGRVRYDAPASGPWRLDTP